MTQVRTSTDASFKRARISASSLKGVPVDSEAMLMLVDVGALMGAVRKIDRERGEREKEREKTDK